MADFQGFPKESFQFLKNLSENNSKEWFQDNRAAYDDYYLSPAKQFVVAMGEALQNTGAKVVATPKINGSIKRINRDVRFSADKSPYKTHLDIFFPEGGSNFAVSGYFFRLFHDSLLLGVGILAFEKKVLEAYRREVDERGEHLAQIVTTLEQQGYPIGGQHYKRVPKGYSADHAHGELLKHKGLHAGITLSDLSWMTSDQVIATCLSHFQKLALLHKFLTGLQG